MNKLTISDITKYYDNFLDILKKDPRGSNPRHLMVQQYLDKIIKPGMTVLDLGCGTEVTSFYMARNLGENVTAVDISPVLIDYARNKYNIGIENINNPRFMIGDIAKLNLNTQFDVITIIDCFEHILPEEIVNLMDVIDKHSKDGTIVYLNIPDCQYQLFIKKNIPTACQIIDMAYPIKYIIELFFQFNLELFQSYSIDVRPLPQYNSYVFKKYDNIDEQYKKLSVKK